MLSRARPLQLRRPSEALAKTCILLMHFFHFGRFLPSLKATETWRKARKIWQLFFIGPLKNDFVSGKVGNVLSE